MARKVSFALTVRTSVSELGNLVEAANVLRDVFVDSGYEIGGSDPIIDADLDGLDMTAADLAQFALLVANINLFMNNGIPAQFDYAAAINAFRNV